MAQYFSTAKYSQMGCIKETCTYNISNSASQLKGSDLICVGSHGVIVYMTPHDHDSVHLTKL